MIGRIGVPILLAAVLVLGGCSDSDFAAPAVSPPPVQVPDPAPEEPAPEEPKPEDPAPLPEVPVAPRPPPAPPTPPPAVPDPPPAVPDPPPAVPDPPPAVPDPPTDTNGAPPEPEEPPDLTFRIEVDDELGANRYGLWARNDVEWLFRVNYRTDSTGIPCRTIPCSRFGRSWSISRPEPDGPHNPSVDKEIELTYNGRIAGIGTGAYATTDGGRFAGDMTVVYTASTADRTWHTCTGHPNPALCGGEDIVTDRYTARIEATASNFDDTGNRTAFAGRANIVWEAGVYFTGVLADTPFTAATPTVSKTFAGNFFDLGTDKYKGLGGFIHNDTANDISRAVWATLRDDS